MLELTSFEICCLTLKSWNFLSHYLFRRWSKSSSSSGWTQRSTGGSMASATYLSQVEDVFLPSHDQRNRVSRSLNESDSIAARYSILNLNIQYIFLLYTRINLFDCTSRISFSFCPRVSLNRNTNYNLRWRNISWKWKTNTVY